MHEHVSTLMTILTSDVTLIQTVTGNSNTTKKPMLINRLLAQDKPFRNISFWNYLRHPT